MKKIEAIVKGKKFTEKLLEIKKRSIKRALDGALDNIEKQQEQATIDYENLLVKLADDDVDYVKVINDLINRKQTIADGESTKKVIEEIRNDLESEVKEEE
jgi:hypothetical protein